MREKQTKNGAKKAAKVTVTKSRQPPNEGY